jgi:hypothetical protein
MTTKSTIKIYAQPSKSIFAKTTLSSRMQQKCVGRTHVSETLKLRAQRVPELFIKFTPSAMERVIYLSMERLIDGVKDEVVMGEWMIHQ